jgi:hypothetical protein
MESFFSDNTLITLAAYWIFNAAVQAIPKPPEGANLFWVWLYNFAHLLSANINVLGTRKKESFVVQEESAVPRAIVVEKADPPKG